MDVFQGHGLHHWRNLQQRLTLLVHRASQPIRKIRWHVFMHYHRTPNAQSARVRCNTVVGGGRNTVVAVRRKLLDQRLQLILGQIDQPQRTSDRQFRTAAIPKPPTMKPASMVPSLSAAWLQQSSSNAERSDPATDPDHLSTLVAATAVPEALGTQSHALTSQVSNAANAVLL